MHTHFLFICFLFLCSGCVASGLDDNNETPPDARIIDVVISPNPATVGDTVTFKVLIVDSLRADLEYQWSFFRKDTVMAKSFVEVTPTLRRVVNITPGEYDGVIRVDDPSTRGLPPEKFFTYTVIE